MIKLVLIASLALFGVTPMLGQVILGQTESFDSIPPVGSWASRAIGGSGGDIDSLASLLAAVNQPANSAASFTTPLGSTTESGTSSGPARVNTTRRELEVAPTSNAATLILATLSNQTGSEVSVLRISYDLTKSATSVSEQVPLEAFFSLTGIAGSWTRLAGLAGEVGTATVQKQVDVTLSSPWANNTSVYVLWADDNANPGTDNIYRMDNVSFTTPVPEPATWATVGSLALLGFATLRRSRR